MDKETQSIGIGMSVIVDEFPISFQASYDSTTLSMEVQSCQLDLAKTANERFNNLNIVLPEDSSNLMIAKFGGSIAKTDREKKPDPSGEYRLIQFDGEMEKIDIPIPIISDIQIDKAYFYYQYISAKSTGTDTDFKDQVVFLGCRLVVKKDTDLYTALTDAALTGAYFLCNNASIIYFDFSGKINVGNIIKALFGVTSVNLTIDVQSAGVFRIAKTNKTKNNPNPNGKPETTVPELTYLDALRQIAHLQGKTKGPTDDSSVTDLMPKSFPLAEEKIPEGDNATPKMGIKVGDQLDTDFSDQFALAFAGDDVTGICFWVMINFNQISFFNSLVTIGYSSQQINSLVLYGFKTQKGNKQENPSSSYFYAQLPGIRLFDFLTFGGLDGRQGILFKYKSDNNEYVLNGCIAFEAFQKQFAFGGNLVVNDDHLLAELTVTVYSAKNIEAPLGMTGINFGELFFCIDNTFEKKAPDKKTEVEGKLDLAIGGIVVFDFCETTVTLSGNIVFEKSEPRLVLVSLDVEPALTLNNFITEVIGKPWGWVDEITRQIGFISGSMYYLEIPKNEKDKKKYTFKYANPVVSKSELPTKDPIDPSIRIAEYKPGYHVHANLLLFEQYVFVIDLDVQTEGVYISGSYGGTYANKTITKTTTISAFFISFESPKLTISTINEPSFYIKIDHIKIFNTDLGNIDVGYSNGIFIGKYEKSKFRFEWQWTKKQGSSGGFSITKIADIEGQDLGGVTEIVKKLNKMSSKGECAAIVNSMFGELKSKFSPALQEGQSPSDNGDGTMKIPLAIGSTLYVGDKIISTDIIQMTLNVTIPNSFSDLPKALFDTVTDNLVPIIDQLLESPAVYKIIALEMAKKGGASLAARMLCRQAKKTTGIELAEELTALLDAGLVVADAGALYELGQVLCAVGIATGAAALLGVLIKAWDTANKRFTDEEEKRKAQEKLDSSKELIINQINSTNAGLKEIMNSIRINKFEVSIHENGDYFASWVLPTNPNLGSTSNLEYQLVFLDGAIGHEFAPKSPIPSIGFKTLDTSDYSEPWAKMRQIDPDFQMNASIQTALTGYPFMTQDAKANLQKTIDFLNEIGDNLEGAIEFNDQLKTFVSDMLGYNEKGLISDLVYATSDNQFRIGQSALGVNTKI